MTDREQKSEYRIGGPSAEQSSTIFPQVGPAEDNGLAHVSTKPLIDPIESSVVLSTPSRDASETLQDPPAKSVPDRRRRRPRERRHNTQDYWRKTQSTPNNDLAEAAAANWGSHVWISVHSPDSDVSLELGRDDPVIQEPNPVEVDEIHCGLKE